MRTSKTTKKKKKKTSYRLTCQAGIEGFQGSGSVGFVGEGGLKSGSREQAGSHVFCPIE